MYGAVSIQLTYLSYDDCLILLLSSSKRLSPLLKTEEEEKWCLGILESRIMHKPSFLLQFTIYQLPYRDWDFASPLFGTNEANFVEIWVIVRDFSIISCAYPYPEAVVIQW